jgi:signal transduction histidine kinase
VAIDVADELTVMGDGALLARALSIVIDNAFRHGAAPVELRARRRGDDIEIVIDDHGPGIPATERDRIFEPFHRGGATRAGATLGTGLGLGLALVRSLLHAHHGTVTAEERPGGGARFRMRLPAAAAPR